MQNFVNNWSALITLAEGTETLAVDLPDGSYRITISDALDATATRWEIVLAEVTGEVATLTRGQEGTPEQDWPANSVAYIAVTAGFLEEIQTPTPGPAGASAYEVAIANGFEGTEAEWLESLRGETGAAGASAYQVAVANGFVGDEAAWLDSLNGEDGANGANGASAYEVAVANGFEGTEEEWLESLIGPGLAIKGSLDDVGDLPASGDAGDGYLIDGDLWVWDGSEWVNAGPIRGPAGLSAYEVAVANGFTGTEVQWLDSLKGEQGDEGPAGDPGAAGASAFEVAVANGFIGTEVQWLDSLKGEQGDEGPAGNPLPGYPYRTITASDDVTPDDIGHWLICNSASPITLTIGAEATESWDVPGILPMFHILQIGAGAVTVTGDGFNVTVHSTDTNVLDGPGSAVTALRTASNTFRLFGRLVAA